MNIHCLKLIVNYWNINLEIIFDLQLSKRIIIQKYMEVAVNDDETEPVDKPTFSENLAIMSIDALNEYIDLLEQEIKRVKQEIEIKRSAREGAESVFKK